MQRSSIIWNAQYTVLPLPLASRNHGDGAPYQTSVTPRLSGAKVTFTVEPSCIDCAKARIRVSDHGINLTARLFVVVVLVSFRRCLRASRTSVSVSEDVSEEKKKRKKMKDVV